MTSPKVVSPSGAATSRNTRILLLQDYRCRAFEHFSVLRPASKWPSSRTARRTGEGSHLTVKRAMGERSAPIQNKDKKQGQNSPPSRKSPRYLVISGERWRTQEGSKPPSKDEGNPAFSRSGTNDWWPNGAKREQKREQNVRWPEPGKVVLNTPPASGMQCGRLGVVVLN